MLKFSLKKYKEQLLMKKAELERNMHQRDGLAIEKSPDLLDQVQLAAERELVVLSCDLESGLLREVRSALDRTGDGSFGVCLECEEPISSRRLNALPWASYCLRCQEAVDQQNGSTGERLGGPKESQVNLRRAA